MKIGIYIQKINKELGGGYTFTKSIFNEILKHNNNHEFIIFYNDNETFQNKKNIFFVPLNKYINFKDKIINRILRKIGKSLKYNILQKAINDNPIDLIWFLTPSYEEVKVPYYLTVWDLQHRLQPYFPEVSVFDNNWDNRENFYKNAIRKASFIITGNNIGKNEISQFYNIPEERIIINPFPVPDFSNYEITENNILEKFELENNKYLFYPAQFWAHKNHIVILLALKILIEKYNIKLKLVFTGSDQGNKNYIIKKVQELKLINYVKFLGFVSINEITSLYKNAFSLVFASFFGPDNLPPLEAMSLNCPVICSKFKGAEEQLKDSALFFDPKDEEELASIIKKLYENKDLRFSLINKGKNLINSLTSENYLKNIINHMENFYKIRRCWETF